MSDRGSSSKIETQDCLATSKPEAGTTPATTELTSTARWQAYDLFKLLTALPAHLVLSVAFFPVYPLTLLATGEHYNTNYATGISFELPTVRDSLSSDREKRIMREVAPRKCRKVLRCSITTLAVCAKAYSREYAYQALTELFILKATLDSIQALYLSFAVESFVNSITKSRGMSAFNYWTPREREIASILMAIPDAFLLGYSMLGGVGVLSYIWASSTSPLLVSLFSSGVTLHEKLQQLLSIIQSNASSTSPALSSRTIVCLVLIEFTQLMVIQCVLRWLQKKTKERE